MKFRKKPVVIEAVQWTGKNTRECSLFAPDLTWPVDAYLEIPTLEGNMRVTVGDYIIKGIEGEFYPCKPDIFEQTYEKVD
jgi:hypothetical protein